MGTVALTTMKKLTPEDAGQSTPCKEDKDLQIIWFEEADKDSALEEVVEVGAHRH